MRCGYFSSVDDADAMGEKLQGTRRGDPGVQLPQTARSSIPGIGEDFFLLRPLPVVQFLKPGLTYEYFSPDLQPGRESCRA